MGTYNVHAGHCPQGQGASGAVGILQESVENRIVKNRVISALQGAGNTVYDTTDDSNCSERQNLYNIVAKCNQHAVDADISLHLNAGRNDYNGDGSTGGVEVLVTGYWQDMIDLAAAISAAIAAGLGIQDRGVKIRKDLYVLNHTNSHSLLVECCFVDDADDAARWQADKCGDIIASVINGADIQGSDTPNITVPSPGTGKIMLNVDQSWGIQTTKRTQQYYGTTQDGTVSNQPASNRQYLCCAWSGSWQFLEIGYDNGSDVIRAMQTDLTNRGYYGGAVDGWCGQKTVIALQKFLRDQGYYVGAIDGSMGPQTVAAWQNFLNNH